MNEPRLIGYARVSTDDQSFDPQVAMLIKAGVPEPHIYREHASGAKLSRKALSRALRAVHPGDTLVVCKLDRLARSLKGLIELAEYLDSEDAHLLVLSDGIDTKTPAGKLTFHILGAIAEFERALISERTSVAMRYKMAQSDWKPGPAGAIAGNPKRIDAWLALEALGLVQRIGRDQMKAKDVVAHLNRADPKAKKIGHENTYRSWKKKGCPGLEKAEEYGEEPLDIEKLADDSAEQSARMFGDEREPTDG